MGGGAENVGGSGTCTCITRHTITVGTSVLGSWEYYVQRVTGESMDGRIEKMVDEWACCGTWIGLGIFCVIFWGVIIAAVNWLFEIVERLFF